jgi:hypothetical protein
VACWVESRLRLTGILRIPAAAAELFAAGEGDRGPVGKDIGKDAGQQLIDVSYRSAAGPCNPSGLWQRVVHDPRTAHPTEILGGEVHTKLLTLSLV